MMSDLFDGGDKDDLIPPVVKITANVDEEASASKNSRPIFGLRVRQSKRAEKPNIMTLMMIQMRSEVEERAHDRS